MDNNIKSSSEIAAQIATNMTLKWNDFNDSVYRRCFNDLVSIGIAAVNISNDPNYGIKTRYVDPARLIHSHTEDPNFGDLIYAGEVRRISIQELKRMANGQIEEEEFQKIAEKVAKKYKYDTTDMYSTSYDKHLNQTRYGYDQYMLEILDFEFKSVDRMSYESKKSKYGNEGFYQKPENYKAPENSVFERKASRLEVETVYGGLFVMGTDVLLNYGCKTNTPKNIHDLSRASLSYSVVATNFEEMVPKSMVDSCIGFADQLQLTHLKIQQAVAKAKPDGIIIDIEGLENVQLGKGGELQPLELHDIYEQTGVFYYRSKNPEGGFQNPPIREIETLFETSTSSSLYTITTCV